MKKLTLARFFSVWFIVFISHFATQAQTAISSFGSNPGLINAYKYVPANMPANAPLVLVLHGCTQTASSYSTETQWDDLADRQKFYVAYGEQTSTNNSLECFNYYLTADNSRGQGEALSLKQITDYMKANYSIDTTRVFVTGLSAGAAMTAVMCACYPDIFAAGAEMSGLPYGCATSELGADLACLGDVSNTPQVWGNYARAQNPGYTGNWPRMAIFQGSADETVNIENSTEMIKQWTNIHGCGQTPGYTNTSFNGNSLITLQQFFDSNYRVPVEFYEIANMAHGTAVYPGTCYQQGGATDALSFNEQFYSPFWAAQFFGILQLPYGITGLANITIYQQGLTYSVPLTAGSVYTWVVPAGVTIVSGQGTNSITVNWNNINGTIYVTEMPTGGCEEGPATLFVHADGAALTLDAGVSNITGAVDTVCSSSITPSFALTDAGTDTLTSVTINYKIDNNALAPYNWAGTLLPNQTVTVTLPAINLSPGEHTVEVICSAPNGGADVNLTNDTAWITFLYAVTPVVYLGTDTTRCGGSVTLNAGNTGDVYTWSNAAVSQSVTVTQTGTYSVTVSNDRCSASGSVNVTIKAVPVIGLAGGNVCSSSLTLDAGNAGGTYHWSNSATTETIPVTASGNYTVTVTGADNCSASSSVTVNLNSSPVINLGTGNFCGNNFTLDAGYPGDTYLWSTSATTRTITGSTGGPYTVTVTGGVNCSSSATVNVRFDTIPNVNLGANDTACSNQFAIDARNTGSAFAWSTGANTQVIYATTSGLYAVTVTGADNCSASDSVNITLYQTPAVNLGAGGVICGTQVGLNAGNTGVVFAWSTGATSQSISATTSGTYSVTVTGSNTCVASDSVTIVIQPYPTVSLVLAPDTVCANSGSFTLQGESPGGGFFSGQQINGSVFNTSTGAGGYAITYSYADSNGCSATVTDSLYVDVCTSIKTVDENTAVNVFPNPNTTGVLFLQPGRFMPGQKAYIFDMTGSLVTEQYITGSTTEMDISKLAHGVYVVSIELEGMTARRKLVIQ